MANRAAEVARPVFLLACQVVLATLVTGLFLGVVAAPPSSPTISNVAAIATGPTSANVSWTTTVAATSRVDYGLTTKYGMSVNDPTLVTAHSMNISGLTCSTLYHYKVTSTNSSGKSASSRDATFTTSPCPLSISAVAATATATTANVTWQTDVPATSQVDYGLTTAYGNTVNDATLVASHSMGLTNLSCGTLYHYKVTSSDSSGNSASSADATFTTNACPLLISGVATTATAATANVSWTTNVAATSRVDYGPTGSYGSFVKDNPKNLVTNHSLDLKNITCGTLYHYQVTSTDSSGTTAISADATFTTDVCPVVISAVTATPAVTTANVTWTTNLAASSQVDYGLSTAYGNTVNDATLVTSHSMDLSSLSCGKLYHYQVTSIDVVGTSATSADATFTTNACPPVISAVTATPGTTSANVTWTTDIAATSEVDYGSTTAYGGTFSDATLVTSHSVNLTSLTCGAVYHYKVVSANSFGTSASSDDATFTTNACALPISDDFSSASLNTSLWNVVDPLGDGTVSLNGTNLLMSVPAGTNHDAWTDGINSLRVEQPMTDSDFDIEVKFDSVPVKRYQMQGILVIQDSGTFIRFELMHDGSSQQLFVASFAASSATVRLFQPICQIHSAYWVRLQRQGNVWTESLSTDGSTFAVVVSFNFAMVVNSIGPYAGNVSPVSGVQAPAFTASVDYFFSTDSPIIPEDGGIPDTVTGQTGPVIDIWYGDTQNFGQNGNPQTWVNILGNACNTAGITSLTYSLNGGAAQPLTLGPNNPRLVQPGDFNAEIDYVSLNPGLNTVTFDAIDALGNEFTRTVTVDYTSGQTWPTNYSIDWSAVTNIQDVAQIADGIWKLQPDGSVRNQQIGYDRYFVFGEANAWTNYSVTAEVTLHSLGVGGSGFGVGILVGWKGSTTLGSEQPRLGHPYGGLAFYRTDNNSSLPQLTILQNTDGTSDDLIAADNSGRTLSLETKYVFRFQVQPNAFGGSHFSFKVWEAGTPEPSTWDLEVDGAASQGSVGLVTHLADVSFGNVTVTSLP